MKAARLLIVGLITLTLWFIEDIPSAAGAAKMLDFSGVSGTLPWPGFNGVYAAWEPWEAVPIKIWHVKFTLYIAAPPSLPQLFGGIALGIAGSLNPDGSQAKDDPLIGYEFGYAEAGKYWLVIRGEQYFRPGSEVVFPASTVNPPPRNPAIPPGGGDQLIIPHIDFHCDGISASDSSVLAFAGAVTIHYDLVSPAITWGWWLLAGIILIFGLHEGWALATGRQTLSAWARKATPRFPII
jgi:hypothetical protein